MTTSVLMMSLVTHTIISRRSIPASVNTVRLCTKLSAVTLTITYASVLLGISATVKFI